MPAGGIMRQVVGELAQSKSKGKKFKKELQSKMGASSVSKRRDKKSKV